jgi:N-acetylmuramoyl-L-alanine amidase
MAKKIYLSPSNQGANTYATGGTNEMAQCDKIAAAAATALKRCGFSVKVGKSGDTMQNRCKESDAFKADIHLPIHTNACNGKVTGGTLVMLYKSSTNHNKAGKALLDAVGKISPGKDYALQYRQDLYELNVPAAMSLYLEVEFHDTKTGSDWIRNNITAIGEAIAKGLCNYYGVTYKAATSSATTPKTETTKLYRVQVGAFSKKANAEAMQKKLKAAGYDAIIV